MSEAETNDPKSVEAMEHVRAILRYIGEDPDREGLIDTPKRVVKAWNEHFWGYREDPLEPLARTFTEIEGYDELVLLQDIEIHSHCEHHMVPFVGKAHVGYIPNGKVTGLSKLVRVVDIYSKRLQPQGVAVVLQCRHFCMCYRGVRQPSAITTTSKLHGIFLENPAARAEFFTLLSLRPE
jgi:GTP cyclohydrolase I